MRLYSASWGGEVWARSGCQLLIRFHVLNYEPISQHCAIEVDDLLNYACVYLSYDKLGV